MAVRAVVFDFFGTLTRAVRRGPLHARVAAELGCEPAAFFEALNRTFPARIRGELGGLPDALREVARQAGHEPTEAQLAAAVAVRLEAIRGDLRLREDALSTLTALRERGLRLAVVSDCSHELPRLLPSLPIAPLLDATVYSIELRRCKPDPVMFTTASERLGVQPAACVYIGDGANRELSGARAVGMTAVRLAAPDLVDHLTFDAEPDWTGPHLSNLTALIAFTSGILGR